MIRGIRELKRRVVWLWRLATSAVQPEWVAGDRTALWLFDTRHAPDGYVLKKQLTALAQRQNLRLVSFGPRSGISAIAIVRLMAMSPLLLSRRFDSLFTQCCSRRIANAVHASLCGLIVVGSAKGTFASCARGIIGRNGLWEVQHGLLDDSYFPMNVDSFFVRSTVSAELIKTHAPSVQLQILSHDLEPPPGMSEYIDPSKLSFIACYSKNPGGGCTGQELAVFENAVIDLARTLKRPLRLYLHPRDSVVKLLVRHRSLKPCAHLWTRTPRSAPPGRLVISSYSTALSTKSIAGDVLVNVRFGPVSQIVNMEYAWLPSIDISQLRKQSNTMLTFRRT